MRRRLAVAALAAVLPGCELQEIVLAEAEDVIVAEVLVQIRDDVEGAEGARVLAALHRTVGTDLEGQGVTGASIVIHRTDGPVPLLPAPRAECTSNTPRGYGLSCYRPTPADEARFRPGDALEIEIELPDGRRMEGAVVVPGDFGFAHGGGSPGLRACGLAPGASLELRWSGAEGAWGYVAETGIRGIRAAMAELGIPMEKDYLHLSGLSITAADTTIVFPREFGLLERFGDDSAVLVALQKGLPPGASASVSIAAVERNYVNWARGGTFNPSGPVRVPSLRGDGTGFFGAAVVRTIELVVPPHPDWEGAGPPECT